MKKCKECGREEWGFLSSLNKDGYCPTCAIKHNQDKIKRLQEQLKEANEVIKKYSDGSIYLFPTWYNGCFEANKYLEKWGVK